jgi:peptide deformylase
MIITDEERLRLPCKDVLPEEIGELRELLEKELTNSARLGRPGIGLALPQINIHKKMAIVRPGHQELNIDLVNCRIEHNYDLAMFRDEGCLSFPGRIENTMRYQEVHITNNLVQPSSMILTGLLAVISQHELDHINGVLLPDRALAKKVEIKLGPNDMCFCGSKRKFKKCHKKVI